MSKKWPYASSISLARSMMSLSSSSLIGSECSIFHLLSLSSEGGATNTTKGICKKQVFSWFKNCSHSRPLFYLWSFLQVTIPIIFAMQCHNQKRKIFFIMTLPLLRLKRYLTGTILELQQKSIRLDFFRHILFKHYLVLKILHITMLP